MKSEIVIALSGKHHIYAEPYRKDEATKTMILVNGVLGLTLSYAEAGD